MNQMVMNGNQCYDWNVIDESEFKKRVLNVFNQVASALVNTLGPYGATSIIEKYGEMHITKDGWQVLKKIHFSDAINNNIAQLLVNISAQVVIKVGDGSTSSIIAANSILSQIENCSLLKGVRSKDLEQMISSAVKEIAQAILERATPVNKENDSNYEEIYKLAMISTNGDVELSKIIQDIYINTNNPSIEYTSSKSNNTTHEIVEGYKTTISYLDPIFIDNDNGTAELDEPLMLMFNHKIDKFHYEKIIQPTIQLALQENKRLVVIAPYYDRFLLDGIAHVTNSEFKAMGKCTTVYTKVSMFNNIATEHYNDFCMMTGAFMISESVAEELGEGKLELKDYIGRVGHISIGDKTSLIKGFINRDEERYKVFLNDAISKYKKVEETHKDLGIVNSELYELKQRVSKLKGKMGIIYVGGNSSLAKTSNLDLAEDAVKACESAYNYGYNIGGNLIIPIVIEEVKKNFVRNTAESVIFDLLSEAFKEVFFKVLANKYNGDSDRPEKLHEIINNCIVEKKCYDLITEQFSDEIINSCQTDIEILKAATSIVSLLVSSNQYISILVAGERQ